MRDCENFVRFDGFEVVEFKDGLVKVNLYFEKHSEEETLTKLLQVIDKNKDLSFTEGHLIYFFS